jgi:hypothetical protein
VATIRQWHAQGRIIATMQIAPQGTSAWQPISSHPLLADLFIASAPAQIPAPTPQQNAQPPAASSGPPSLPPPPVPGSEKQAIDKGREAAVSYMRELHKVSPMAFWGVMTSSAGILFCCGCGGLMGITGMVLGILSLDRNNIKEGQTQLDARIRNGAVAAIVLGFGALLVNGVGMGFLMWARAHNWFGMK